MIKTMVEFAVSCLDQTGNYTHSYGFRKTRGGFRGGGMIGWLATPSIELLLLFRLEQLLLPMKL